MAKGQGLQNKINAWRELKQLIQSTGIQSSLNYRWANVQSIQNEIKRISKQSKRKPSAKKVWADKVRNAVKATGIKTEINFRKASVADLQKEYSNILDKKIKVFMESIEKSQKKRIIKSNLENLTKLRTTIDLKENDTKIHTINYDYKEDTRNLDKVFRDIRALLLTKNPNSYAHIQISGIGRKRIAHINPAVLEMMMGDDEDTDDETDDDEEKIDNTSKEFGDVLIRNYNNLFTEIIEWAMVVNQSYQYVEINFVEVRITRENGGGCRSGYDKVDKIDGLKVMDYRASNNNCFFRCIKDELGWDKLTPALCNQVREKFNIGKNEVITVSKAIEIYNIYCKNAIPLYILDSENMTIYSSNGDFNDAKFEDKKNMVVDRRYKQIMLVNNHYVVIEGEVNVEMKCPICYNKYINYHNCSLKDKPECKNCGARHDVDKKCNNQKLTYYQTKIAKNKTRFVVNNFQPEELRCDNVIHYDIETHSKTKFNINKTYIIGYTIPYRPNFYVKSKKNKVKEIIEQKVIKEKLSFDGDEMFDSEDESDFEMDNVEVEKDNEKKRYNFDTENKFLYVAGENCMESFVKMMLSKYEKGNEITFLNAFNGANFDHYEFVKEALRQGRKPDNFVIANGSIVRASYGKLVLIDVAKHTEGSLKKNLKNFNCEIRKGDFHHSKGNEWENMTMRDKMDCIKYLEADVMGLKQLFEKLNKEVNAKYKCNIQKFFSTSQLTYSMWVHSLIKDQKHLISLPTIEQEKIFRSGCYGARCYKSKTQFTSKQYEEYTNGNITLDEVEDFIIDEDVISLYPTAMERYEYPVGLPTQLTDPAEFNRFIQSDKQCPHMGYYYIKYKPNKYLAHAVLPNKNAKGGLEWTLYDGEGYYNSVDIDNALKHGYDIEIVNGWYWTEKAYIFTDYIRKLYQTKSEAKKGTPEYAVAKLFMNGLYGKMIQRPISEHGEWINSNAHFWKFYSKYSITSMKFIGEKMYLVGIPRDEEQLEKCITKPTHLGGFILAYSRRIMLEYFEQSNPYFDISKINDMNINEAVKLQMDNDFYYSDTDSIHVNCKNAIPLNKGVLGGLDDDLGGAKIIHSIYIAPKLYMSEYYNTKNEKHFHLRGKGIQNDKLSDKIFKDMLDGKAITLQRDFQFKKIHLNRNSKQVGIDNFSIQYITGKQTERTINNETWAGRCFIGNTSLPWGHFYLENLGINI
jgi:hypothetical protein